jgi:sulfur transfer protein SufE
MVNGKSIAEIKNMDMEQEFKSLNLNLGAARLNGVNSMIRFFKKL